MPDSNPALTTTLKMLRDGLLTQREALLREYNALKLRVEQNTVQVEAADTLILAHDPNHVSVDLRNAGETAPMVVVPHQPLQLTATTAETPASREADGVTVLTTVSEAAAAKPEIPVVAEPKTVEPVGAVATTVPEVKKGKSKAAEEPKAKVRKTKAPSVASKEIIANYFTKMKRSDVLLDILSKSNEPIRAPAITSSFRELYPISIEDQDVKTMLSSRISATLYAMEARGQTIRTEKETAGKAAEVFWVIDPVYRDKRDKELARSKKKLPKKVKTSAKPNRGSVEQPANTEAAGPEVTH